MLLVGGALRLFFAPAHETKSHLERGHRKDRAHQQTSEGSKVGWAQFDEGDLEGISGTRLPTPATVPIGPTKTIGYQANEVQK